MGAREEGLKTRLLLKVTDEKDKGVPMAIVTFSSLNTTDENERFLPVPKTTVHVDNETPIPDWASSYSDIHNINNPVTATLTYPMTDDSTAADVDDAVIVQTDSNGEAEVYFQLHTLGENEQSDTQNVRATSLGRNVDFRVTAISDRVANLEIVSGNPQSATKGKQLAEPLVVITRSSGGA